MSDESNTRTFQAAVADSMKGIRRQDITNINAKEGPQKFSSMKTVQSSNSVEFSYYVNANSPSQTFEELFDQLKQSVSSGDFTKYLQQYAVTLNGFAFLNAYSDYVSGEIVSAGTYPPTKEHVTVTAYKNDLSDADIIGLCIGLIGGFLVIGIGIFVLTQKK